MSLSSAVRRAGVVVGATTAIVLASSTAASAHHCYIPMYTLSGPASANWFVVSAEMGAAEFAGVETECDAQRDAGYAALNEAGLPVGVKVFEKMVIGSGMQEKGKGVSTNPNGANDVGLEYFESGSTLADDMLGTYIEGVMSTSCDD